ncbi:VOC family protein [Trichothermofontia sp.]
MNIERLDHLVLTVRDLNSTCTFYTQVLGMTLVTHPPDRPVLVFGTQHITLHVHDQTHPLRALQAVPGSANLCLITSVPVPRLMQHLHHYGVRVIEGPLKRPGASGMLLSIYCRDPDGNLLELANDLANTSGEGHPDRPSPNDPMEST